MNINQTQKIPRLPSLDILRGLTIVLMIIVNSPGLSTTYPILEHAVWNGCTFADLVFPFFIIIMGTSSTIALTNLKLKGLSTQDLMLKIARRSAELFLIGLLLNAFPHHLFDYSSLRIMGVLQRIALCYFFSSLLFLTTSRRLQLALIAVILLGYHFLIVGFSTHPVLTMNDNLVGHLDLKLFSAAHLYTATFDPEGLLSTLPALASALCGNLLGFYLISSKSKQQQLQQILLTGFVLALLGWLWSFIFPLNKALWSSSYALWSAGISFLAFGLCFALIEIKQWTRWSKPFALFGQSAMLIYVVHVLGLKLQALIHIENQGEVIGLRPYLTKVLFGALPQQPASLAYALSYTLLCFILLVALKKRSQRHKNK